MEHHQNLKQGRVAKTALRVHFRNQLLEWEILVRVSLQRHTAHSLQYFDERWIAGKIRSKDQCVHKEPDEVLDLLTVAIRGWCSDDNVSILSCVATKQDLECRQQGQLLASW